MDDPKLTQGRSQPAIIGLDRAIDSGSRRSRYRAGAHGGASPDISALTMDARDFRGARAAQHKRGREAGIQQPGGVGGC